MNTLVDVLLEVVRLLPAREEATVSKMTSIIEDSREKLEEFLAKPVEQAVETVESDEHTAQTNG